MRFEAPAGRGGLANLPEPPERRDKSDPFIADDLTRAKGPFGDSMKRIREETDSSGRTGGLVIQRLGPGLCIQNDDQQALTKRRTGTITLTG
jgi:hypothetical protein